MIDNNPSHPRSKSASVNKASRDRREQNNRGCRGRQHNSPQSPPLSKKATFMHNSRLSHHASSQDGRHSKAHVYDLSDEDEHIPEGLPTLPLQTLKQIRAHEFINFNSLLASTLFSPDSDNIDDLRYKIDFSRKKGFSSKASNPARRSLCDLSSFMKAWNSFLKATLYFYPEMLDEMLGYQKLICELAARYKPVAWLAYDKEHRQACAINHNLRWDKRNTDAFQRHVEGNSLPICYICKRVGHRSLECPGKEKDMPLFPEVNPRFFTPQPQAANHSGVALLPPPSPAYPTLPSCPFVPQPSPPLSQRPSSVDYSTRQAGVLLGVHQKHTAVTGMVAGDSTPGPSALSCPGTGDIFNNLFVPLPNCIETPINVAKFVKELEGYPFPDVVTYLVTGFQKGFSLGYTGSQFAITPKNLKSALDNESHVTAAIIKELERKHIAGPSLKPLLNPFIAPNWGQF